MGQAPDKLSSCEDNFAHLKKNVFLVIKVAQFKEFFYLPVETSFPPTVMKTLMKPLNRCTLDTIIQTVAVS